MNLAPVAASPARNLGHLVVVSAVVTVATFLLVRVAPGDAVSTAVGGRGTDQSRVALRAELGLDDPLPTQFTSYVTGLFRGDLGPRWASRAATWATSSGRPSVSPRRWSC